MLQKTNNDICNNYACNHSTCYTRINSHHGGQIMSQEPKKVKKSRKQNLHSTMTDLAAETGLSKMTISRVFTGSANVRKNTKDKVMEAAEKMGYEYNALAGNFASGRSRLVGVAVDVSSLMGSRYFSHLFKGAHGFMEDAGYRSVIFDTGSEEFADGDRLSRLIDQRRVEGMLAFVPPQNHAEFISSFSKHHTSIVVIGGRSTAAQVPWVDLDNHHAVELLVNHLVRLGHQKIGFIAGPKQIVDATERSKAFHSIREKLNLPWEKDWLQSGEFSYGAGREAAHCILSLPNPPTAIIAANDSSALGACEAVRAYGMMPGKEISIAGIDGHEIAAEAEPAITTVTQPLEEMGEHAAKILLKQIEKQPVAEEDTHTIFKGKLIARPSTGPAPR